MENVGKVYTGRNIWILSDSQATIEALDSFWINSKFVWYCHQSLVKQAGHNRIRLVRVLGHMEIVANEIAGWLARQSYAFALTGRASLGIFADIARGVSRGWTSRKLEEYWQSICKQRHTKGFLKRLSAKSAWELLNFSRNQLRTIMELLTKHCHLKGCLFKLGMGRQFRVW